jgi:hypothetical protein
MPTGAGASLLLGDRVPDVPEDIRTMMETMSGTIEIDEYP